MISDDEIARMRTFATQCRAGSRPEQCEEDVLALLAERDYLLHQLGYIDIVEREREKLLAVAAAARRLRSYAWHTFRCQSARGVGDCDCGFLAAARALDGPVRTAQDGRDE